MGNRKSKRAILMQCWTEDGSSYFPEKYSKEDLISKRETMGTSDFAHQYLNVPLSKEEATFRKEDIEYFQNVDKDKNLATFMTMDLGGSEKGTSTPTGVVVMQVDKDDNWYIQHARAEYLDTSEIIREIFRLYKVWKPEKIGIEREKYSIAIGPFLEQEQKNQNIHLPIEELKLKVRGRINKDERIKSLQPKLEKHEILLKRGQLDLIDEIIKFPRGEKDVLDALSRMYQIVHPPKKGKKRRRPKELDPVYLRMKQNKRGGLRKYYDKLYYNGKK